MKTYIRVGVKTEADDGESFTDFAKGHRFWTEMPPEVLFTEGDTDGYKSDKEQDVWCETTDGCWNIPKRFLFFIGQEK